MATYTESFESSLGNWVSSGHSGWRRDGFGTPSGSTGPSSAYSGSYYVYVETSSSDSFASGDTDYLTFTFPEASDGTINYAYHQYGSNQGTITLEVLVDGSWQSLWSSSGDQGNTWYTNSETYTNATQIRFKNVAAGNFRGDIALDLIVLDYENTTPPFTPASNVPEETTIDATGGNIIDVEIGGKNYRIHAFTSSGTFTVNEADSTPVDVLVVAGGGGGGGADDVSAGGGGGGAGGLVYQTTTVSNQAYSITVGSGGAGVPYDGRGTGSSGSNSSAFDLTAIGGGGGGSVSFDGLDGGSGGGTGRTFSPGSGTAGQGNNGGSGSSAYGGGGGGGASTAGQSASTVGGNGGSGIDYSNIFTAAYGENGYFAGGGGGGADNNYNTAGSGGLGGGGNGLTDMATPSSSNHGQSNTGGGGGGSATQSNTSGSGTASGNGGSGIVLIRYELIEASSSITHGTDDITSIFHGSNQIYRVYSGTELIFSTSFTYYEFGDWSSYSLDSSCSPNSFTCSESTVGQSEKECRCDFTDWSAWSVTNGPISAINNSCSDGAVQQEVARETRSCTYESTPIYGCNTGAWSSWSNVSSCTSSYGTGACDSTLDRQCRTINTCSCTAWSAYQDWTSGTCSNQGNSCGTELECSSRTQCSTCYGCTAGAWSAWSNVSSCTTGYGTGACSSTVNRECQTVQSSSCTWEVIQTQYPGTCSSPNSPACSDGVIWYEQRYAGSTPFCLVQRGVVTTTSQVQQRTRSTSTYSYSCNCYSVPTFRTRNCTGNPNQRQQQTRTTTQVITGYDESCNCGSWQSFTNVSSCDEVNDGNGCQTQRCQSRSRVGFTESRTRTCTENTI